MDNQLYNYFLAKMRWEKELNDLNNPMKATPVNIPLRRFITTPIAVLGKMMVSAGRSLQAIAQPSYHQPVTKSNL